MLFTAVKLVKANQCNALAKGRHLALNSLNVKVIIAELKGLSCAMASVYRTNYLSRDWQFL